MDDVGTMLNGLAVGMVIFKLVVVYFDELWLAYATMYEYAKSRVHVDLEDPLQSHACEISSSSAMYVSSQHQNKYKYSSTAVLEYY